MSSLRETLLANLKTALERIQGPPDYTYELSPEQIQRPVHHWDGTEETVNRLGDLPVILLRPQRGAHEMQTVDIWSRSITVDLAFYLRDPADDEDVNAALADMLKALFVDFQGWGVGAFLVSLEDSLVDTETGQPLDGIHLLLTCTYPERFGAPDSGG